MIPAADRHRKGIKISVDWLHAELKWSQGLAAAPHPIWAESHQTRSQHTMHERTLTPPVSLFTATFHAVHWGQPHVQRNRLRGVWISLPHNHGAVCAGHHRNVQRAQQVSRLQSWRQSKRALNVTNVRNLLKESDAVFQRDRAPFEEERSVPERPRPSQTSAVHCLNNWFLFLCPPPEECA